MEKALLTVKEAASYLNISEHLLRKLTQPRGPIPCVRLGTGQERCKRLLYSIESLDAWIRDQLKQKPAHRRDA
jgi:excisionase family DNA binding protein